MNRRHPLTYPAPAQAKIHTKKNRRVLRDYYAAIFHSQLMRGPFKKISGHGTVPIILGAAVTATGHAQMLVRSLAVIVCAVWFSLDVGVWLTETVCGMG
jgi:hypothetical protein